MSKIKNKTKCFKNLTLFPMKAMGRFQYSSCTLRVIKASVALRSTRSVVNVTPRCVGTLWNTSLTEKSLVREDIRSCLKIIINISYKACFIQQFVFINTLDSLSILIGREGITWGCLNGWYNTSKKCWNMCVTRELAPVLIRQFLHSYWSRANGWNSCATSRDTCDAHSNLLIRSCLLEGLTIS